MRLGRNTDRSVDFSELHEELRAAAAPSAVRRQRVIGKYEEWFRRELARPTATIEGGAPDQVNEALQRCDAESQKARRGRFNQHRERLIDELEQRATAAHAALLAAASALEALLEHRSQCARFASAAGCYMPEASTPCTFEAELTGHAVDAWFTGIMRRVKPPKPAPILRPEDNPLILDGV